MQIKIIGTAAIEPSYHHKMAPKTGQNYRKVTQNRPEIGQYAKKSRESGRLMCIH
jgi:hypothetical protein